MSNAVRPRGQQFFANNPNVSLHCLKFLSPRELCGVARVCAQFNGYTNDKRAWDLPLLARIEKVFWEKQMGFDPWRSVGNEVGELEAHRQFKVIARVVSQTTADQGHELLRSNPPLPLLELLLTCRAKVNDKTFGVVTNESLTKFCGVSDSESYYSTCLLLLKHNLTPVDLDTDPSALEFLWRIARRAPLERELGLIEKVVTHPRFQICQEMLHFAALSSIPKQMPLACLKLLHEKTGVKPLNVNEGVAVPTMDLAISDYKEEPLEFISLMKQMGAIPSWSTIAAFLNAHLERFPKETSLETILKGVDLLLTGLDSSRIQGKERCLSAARAYKSRELLEKLQKADTKLI